MNRKQKKELRQRQSTRQLMGIVRVTPHGIVTDSGERVFFLIQPDNLSVLSPEVIRGRVRSLTMLLSTQPSLEILALDSRESFQRNKEYYLRRLEEETEPAVRELLERDMAHLDAIQFSSASSRKFVLVLPLDEKAGADESALRQLEKAICDHGLRVRLAEEQDVKRLLAIYYRQDLTRRYSVISMERSMYMAKKKAKKKKKAPEQIQRPKDFLDMIAPAAVKFNTDHFILGSRYHTAMALKSYPPMTDELALLRGLGDMGGVNLRLTARQVTPAEEDAILHAATNKSRMERSNTNDYKQSVTAEANLRDMAELLAKQRQEKEPLIHCGVYLDIAAADTEKLRTARDTVSAQLVRSRMGADPLLLRQREGFLSANPAGGSQLANFAERVLPARSVANLYPMNYSGKTDPRGFFIGRDRFGSNIIVDFDRRAPDKTNASALILGNTGQGKSYLLKLLLCNVREAGKSVISLDSEHEMEDECRALDGCFLDYLSGQYRINLLEPRCWDDGSGPEDPDAPDAFRGTLLSQHISFLRDVFRVYKGFDTPHIDTLELMVERLYQKWNITDRTDFASMQPTDYPILSDLYDAIQESYDHYEAADSLYPREMLRDLLLGLHSMCRGADARFFNGHTNITNSKFLVFCVKGLDNMAENLRNTLLFSLLSYMSDQLLTLGNSVAAIDELYLWLSDPTVITYIRNALKRVRKKESALFLASQNLEDFTQPGIRELTRPLFSIPVHQFIFNGGNVDKKFFMDNLQLEESEYALIRDPQRGSCLYKCGNERYLLQVRAPEYKQTIFGTAGGR